MRKLLLPLVLIIISFAACIKDKNLKRYTYYVPEYATAQEVRDNVKLDAPKTIENMGNMIVYNNYILAVEQGSGIHIIDASNIAAPVKKGFIPIPGNQNMAIRNNYLYADCYTDLFVIDLNDLQNIKLTSVKEDIFKSQTNVNGFVMDKDHIIVNWILKDTMVTQDYIQGQRLDFATNGSAEFFSGSSGPSFGSGGGNSTGGSMARFTLVNDNMYAVDLGNLYTLSLSNPTAPVLLATNNVGWGIETIYPFKDKLFVGSNSGMFIYNISNPASPQKMSEFVHARACDPVIANDNYAFVTLRSGSVCQGFINQMEVINIANIYSPQLIKTYPFTNPRGLSMSGNTMFLCDGLAGLRVLDMSDVNNIVEKKQLKIGEASDVITIGNVAYVVTADNIYLYEFTNTTDVTLKGTLNK